MSSLIDIIEKSQAVKKITNAVHEHSRKVIYSSPLPGSTRSLLASYIFGLVGKVALFFPDKQSLSETKVELGIICGQKNIIVADELTLEQLQEKLTTLSHRETYIFLSTYELLRLKQPPASKIDKNTTRLQLGGDVKYDDLIEYLSFLNYTKTKFVESPGSYSVRGAIIDFWSYSESSPSRVEYDGDFLESIRTFDADNQRSTGKTDSVTIAQSFENERNESELTSDILDYLTGSIIMASEYDLNKIFEGVEWNKTESKMSEAIPDDLKEELLGDVIAVDAEPEILSEPGSYNQMESFSDLFKKDQRWLIESQITGVNERLELNLSEAPSVNSNFEAMFEILKVYTSKGYRTFITAENEFQSKRLSDLLSNYKEELSQLIESGKVKIIDLALNKGFVIKEEGIAVLTDYQLFSKPYRTKTIKPTKNKKSLVKDFSSLRHGDYVVHEGFGIGKYDGLHTIKIGDVEQESIKILYADGGVVYVNLNYLNLVKKYSSKEGEVPKLSTLGSGEWDSAKRKVKKKIKEAARELIRLYAKRKSTKGFAFNADTIWQKELEASFFYEDTPDQVRITDDVKSDMESENPMDRLVCGDVGFGKTEVAVRAAFKAAMDGKQIAVLVPTTILAEQHLNTFRDRLNQFPVKIAGLSRFQNKASQTEIIKSLSEGNTDIVIGTHRLLSKDVQFKDLGLLIIDEEHRFGVMAKEKLKSIKLNVDSLAMTATPIPRTLNLSLLGARDLSIMTTPPPNRQSIYTRVETFDILKIKEWINNELRRGGQVYFVHDRVQSIEKIAMYIKKYMPEVKIAVAHGQMKPAQLENVIYDFLHKDYDVLLATKIIESGIDIPNVNTIIINRADRFGLAELHQLRGRVGRSNRQAYAFLLVPSLNSVTKKSLRRLQAIEEFTDVGAGFNLAMRDLEIRGAGNLLGTEQTGFIDSIGFDLYVKLLDEAVEELKREEFQSVFKDLPKKVERSEPTVDTYFEIGIPRDYMPDQADRLSFYTAMFSLKEIDDMKEIIEEMEDRFGKMPVKVRRLVATAALKYYASFALFERVIIQASKVIFILPKGNNEEFYKSKFHSLMKFVVEHNKNVIKFTQVKDTMKLTMSHSLESPEKIFEHVINFCKRVSQCYDS